MRFPLLPLLLAVLAIFLTAWAIHMTNKRCTTDKDCADGKICNAAGRCGTRRLN